MPRREGDLSGRGVGGDAECDDEDAADEDCVGGGEGGAKAVVRTSGRWDQLSRTDRTGRKTCLALLLLLVAVTCAALCNQPGAARDPPFPLLLSLRLRLRLTLPLPCLQSGPFDLKYREIVVRRTTPAGGGDNFSSSSVLGVDMEILSTRWTL